MRLLKSLGALLAALVVLAVGAPALAVTWTPVSTWTPSGGPLSSVGAGLALQGGWIDNSGHVWSTNASNQLNANVVTGSPWNTGLLLRPTGEDAVNSRVQIHVTTNTANAAALWGASRITTSGGNTTAYAAAFYFVSGSWQVEGDKIVSGATTTIVARTAVTLSNSTAYCFQFDTLQTGTGTTTLTIAVLDSTCTTVIGSTSGADTTAGLQNASGQQGVFNYIPTGSNLVETTLATYTVSAATAITVTGPANGLPGVASSAFTVAANGSLGSSCNVTITPSPDGSVTTSPVALAAVGGPSGSFTYTPASTGTKTLTVTNSCSLTNPSPVSYGSMATVAVNNAAFHFSPATWKGDTGRGGSVYRQTWNNGSYFEVVWATGSSPAATLLLPTSSTTSYVTYSLNGQVTSEVAATAGNISLSPTANATNTLIVWIRNAAYNSRWNQASAAGNTFQVDGLAIDPGSSAGTAPVPTKWVLIVGDSITEGTQTLGCGSQTAACDDNLLDYSWAIGQALIQAGYDYAISACGYSGWIEPGDSTGDVPAYYLVTGGVYSEANSRWDKVDQGVSLLDSNSHISAYGSTGQEPAAILVNYGTNEALDSASTSDMTLSVSGWLAAARAAAPNAEILPLMPFGLQWSAKYSQAYVTALNTGVSNYLAANPSDTKTVELNLGSTIAATLQQGTYFLATVDQVHFNQTGHAFVAPMVTNLVFGYAGLNSFAGSSSGVPNIGSGGPGLNVP